MAGRLKRAAAAAALGPILAAAGVLLTFHGSCGPPWRTMEPAAPPQGAVRICPAEGRVELIPGFLTDGEMLAVWSRLGDYTTFHFALSLYDPAAGKVTWRQTLAPGHDLWQPILLHRGGAAVVGDGRTAELWRLDRTGGRRIARWDIEGGASPCVLSADGRLLAIAAADGIRLHDAATGKLLRTLGTDDERYRTLVLSPDGRLFASIGGETIRISRVGDGWELEGLRLPPGCSPAMHGPLGFSAGGEVFIPCESHHLPTPPGHREVIAAAASAPAAPAGSPEPDPARSAAAVRMGGSTLVYEVATGRLVHRLDLRSTISGNQRFLVEWPEGKTEMHVYDLPAGCRKLTISGALATPAVGDGALAAAEPLAGPDSRIRSYGFWDLASGRKIGAVTLQDWSWNPVALSPDGRWLLLRSGSGLDLCLADRQAGGKVLQWRFPADHGWPPRMATAVCFSRAGRYLAFDAAGKAIVVNLGGLAK